MTTSKLLSLMPSTPRSRVAIAANILLLVTLTAGSVASANTCVWTGASDGSWSTAGNWSACSGNAPINGDTLQFPEAAAIKNNINDLLALTNIAGVAFTGSTSGYNLSGNTLTIGAGGITNSNTTGSTTVLMPIALAAAQTFAGNTGAMVLDGGVILGNQQLSITWPVGIGSVVPWTINGAITGAGGITATGAGANHGLILGGSNTFTGAVVLVSGYTELSNPNALGVADGTVANGLSVGSTATLLIANNINIGNEALTLAAGGGQNNNGMVYVNGTSNWSGPVQLTGPGTSSLIGGAGNLLALSGPITGAGGFDLGFDSAMVYRLSNSANTFAGVVRTRAPFGAVVQLGADNVLPDTAVVDLKGASSFDLDGKDDTVAALRCTATDKVIIPFGSELTVGDSTNSTCAGVISGTFSTAPITLLTKVGSGTLTLTGINTYPGEVNVLGGGLEVNGELIPDPTSAIFVSSGQGAKLFGTGTVGNVVTAGIIHGGSATTPGMLTTGALTFNGVGTLTARLHSAASYDRIKAANVTISASANLIAPLFYVPTAGTSFTLIENLGGAVQGEFNGLPEGIAMMLNGNPFVLSYVGGDGNDITLTSTAGPAPASVTYTPPTGTAPVVSASGIGSIAATATNFAPSSTVSISGCAVTPSSPAFPVNALTVVNPSFASPNGSIGITCAPQASATSGTLSCNEAFAGGTAPTARAWPITCPAAMAVGVAPTAALTSPSVGLVDGVGAVGVNVLTSGVAVGSLDLDCSIPPGTANFQITSGGQRLINAPAILGADFPVIGLSCVEQSTTQVAMLSCAQTANPGPNPADLTAMVTCRAAAQPPLNPVVPIPTLARSVEILLALSMLLLGAYAQRQSKRRVEQV